MTSDRKYGIVNNVVKTWCFGSVGRAHRSHRWGHWFESSKHHQKKRPSVRVVFSFGIRLMQVETSVSRRCALAHRWGAEPKRALWAMKRGGSVVSKGACRAAARAGDYCEPDRAQRDHWFESSKHHQKSFCLSDKSFFSCSCRGAKQATAFPNFGLNHAANHVRIKVTKHGAPSFADWAASEKGNEAWVLEFPPSMPRSCLAS